MGCILMETSKMVELDSNLRNNCADPHLAMSYSSIQWLLLNAPIMRHRTMWLAMSYKMLNLFILGPILCPFCFLPNCLYLIELLRVMASCVMSSCRSLDSLLQKLVETDLSLVMAILIFGLSVTLLRIILYLLSLHFYSLVGLINKILI